MEELLEKNIFSGNELMKLCPDYIPSNLLLRIKTRSTMVKDTHTHKFKDDSCQRKSIKRPKETFKIGKEIAKIRNGFENINLKNNIMLKNALKVVDGIKAEDNVHDSKEECNFLEKEEEKYFKDISEMNLVLKNDDEFKLCDKPKVNKSYTKKKSDSKSVEKVINDNNEVSNGFAIEDVLRIECRAFKHTEFLSETICMEKTEHDCSDENLKIECENLDTIENLTSKDNLASKHVERDGNDLQTLLVMLAISPNASKEEKETNSESRNGLNVYDETSLKDYHYGDSQVNLMIKSESSTHSTDYNFLNVVPIKVEINDKQQAMLKRFVEKWKAYITRKKELEKQQREQKLNCFLDKLSKRKMSICDTPESPVNKAKLYAKDYNRYRHRYQMQKHIIALQKAKLEEQSRIIEELKCNRIIDASKISVDVMREEVRKTYYEMDKHLKPKLKCLTNELKVELQEPSLVLHCLKVPQFLQRMEKRAREREEKHAMIRERRKQMEEERIRLKQQEEIAKAQMDKEEKLKRMKELKDKRRKEKIENIRKKQHAERMRALTVMADLHYEKTLKTKYAIRPLRMLVAMKKDNIEKAKAHYTFQLKKNVFLKWMWLTEDAIFERNFQAEDYYRKKMLRKCFEALKKNHHSLVLKKQVAEDYYDLFVTNLVFRKFREAINIVKKEHEMKWQKAALYHNSNLVFRAFSCWRTLPALNALQREQEARKARWREKVLQVVPDYTPPEF